MSENSPKQLSNARVSTFKLNSTGPIEALAVVQLDSTGGLVTGGAGGGSTQVSVREIQTLAGDSVMDSTNNSIGVTIRAGSASGTEYTDGDVDASISGQAILFNNSSNTLRAVGVTQPLPVSTGPIAVSSVAGAVIVRSSAANALVTGYQSTYTDFQALAGIRDRDNSTATAAVVNATAPASSAYGLVVRMPAPVTDSTNNALRVNVVAGAAGGSTEITIRQSTFSDLNCRINAPSTANSSNYLPVRITDGSSYISPGVEYSDGSTFSTMTGPGLLYNNSSNQTMRLVGISQPLPVQLRTSSGAEMVDSTETAIRVNVVAGAAAGSTLITVRQSTVGDFRAAVYQSTAADLNVTVAGYSTTVNVSSLGGAVIVRSSAANHLITAYQSTAADFNATVTLASSANSVLARVTTSSGGGIEGSTLTAAGNILGLHTRPIIPTLLSTTLVITSTHSTAIYPLLSSAAAPLRHKVYAYFVSSTHTHPSTLLFCSSASGSGFDHWHVGFGSGSSGISGANLVVAPPGFIFAGIANNALNVKVEGGSSAASTVIVRVSIGYFTEA